MRNATEPPGSPSFQSTAPGGRAVSVPTRASSAKMICCICSDKGSSEGHDTGPRPRQRAYRAITRSMARRHTAQKPTSSRVNMVQSTWGR